MQIAGLDNLLWAGGLIGHIVLLCVLFGRRRARRFPVFTALIGVNVLRSVVLYCTLRLGTPYEYFYTYWSLAIVDVGMQLAVVYELASQVFRPLGTWAKDVQNSLLLLILFSVLVAVALTLLAAPPAHDWRQIVVIRGSFFSATLMSELFVGMIALSTTVGLPWKSYTARISQGLGIYSIVCILVEASHSYFGSAAGTALALSLTRLRMCIYIACIGFWVVMLWRNETVAEPLPDDVRLRLALLRSELARDLPGIRARRRW